MENYNSRLHTLGNWFRRHKDWILMAIGLGFLFWLIYDLARSRLIELSTAGIILGVGLLLVALANFSSDIMDINQKQGLLESY